VPRGKIRAPRLHDERSEGGCNEIDGGQVEAKLRAALDKLDAIAAAFERMVEIHAAEVEALERQGRGRLGGETRPCAGSGDGNRHRPADEPAG
jgi:hypothetical protein